MARARTFAFLVGSVLALASSAVASADSVRFHFVPAAEQGGMAQVATGPGGAPGELRTGLSGTPKPFPYAFKANRMVTFRHPYTSKNVTLPLKLPDSTPRVEHIGDRVRFNYGSYYVESRFRPDGSADVIYSSGLLRPLPP
jgi:hypothetical protein